MTSQNTADSEGLWPLPANHCPGRQPGWYRTLKQGGWAWSCVNAVEIGQNGRYMKRERMCDDLHAVVPGQLELSDVETLASEEDVAAAAAAERWVQAILAGERPKLPDNVVTLNDWKVRVGRTPGFGVDQRGVPFRAFEALGAVEWHRGNVSMLPSFFNTPTLDEKSISVCETIAPSPVASSPEEV